MQKWGWSKDYTPELYTRADARALSPCGWVGQNMLYQRFIVLDANGKIRSANAMRPSQEGIIDYLDSIIAEQQ